MKIEYSIGYINDIDELLKVFTELRGWLFRGQKSVDFELESSLERYCGKVFNYPDYARKMEDTLLSEFKSRAHLYLSKDIIPETKLGWLSLMQHHGCPTRLLDFTTSPYVSLFFAQDGFNPDDGKDMCIWAISNSFLEKESFDYLTSNAGLQVNYPTYAMNKDNIFESNFDKGGHSILLSIEPKVTNLRLENQAGLFILSGTYSRKFKDYFEEISTVSNVARKLVISKDLIDEVVLLLMDTGINNRRIYPGIDGVAKDIASKLKVGLNVALAAKAKAAGLTP